VDPELAPRRFLRAFGRALTSDDTYDIRRNPSIWLGFVMALPIPIMTLAASAPPWLVLLSLPAPLFWAVVLGAAGRVGILAQQEKEQLEKEVERTRLEAEKAQHDYEEVLDEYEEALDEEVERRKVLETREREALSELKLASDVQRTLVPDDIQRPDLEVAVSHIPSTFVGGDYLHAMVVDDRWAYLCIGDVAGHGISAALVVARIHGLVRRLTLERRSRPEAALATLNRAALHILRHTYFFMTFAILRLDLRTGVLEYATAGHPAQVLLRRDGHMELLRTPNRLMGMDADIFSRRRPSDRVQLEPGDSLVLFSDGLFEIEGASDREVLGEQGLHDRIATLRGLSPRLMAGEILQDLADFQGRSTFEDDVSLMVAQYNGPP
jgi:serine phosphatase RsbU (regulator of sigma subunit)